jgi:hypothetical protein
MKKGGDGGTKFLDEDADSNVGNVTEQQPIT